VPNYNHEKFLEKRLESIFNQTYTNFEVILLDDASTDHSVEILSNYVQMPQVSHFIVNETNSGSPFKQWKKGIELAKGEFVWIAESDDWAETKFLESLVPIITRDLQLGIVFSNSNWVDQNGTKREDLSIYNYSFRREGLKEICSALAFKNTIQNASACLLRKSVIELSTFPDDTKACGDWILYVQMLCRSDIQYLSERLNNFRWYHDNTSHATQRDNTWTKEGGKIHLFISLNRKNFHILFIRRAILFWLKKIENLKKTDRDDCLNNMKGYGIFLYLVKIEFHIRKLLV